MSVITDHIVLAGLREVNDEVNTKNLGVTHILNVASEIVIDRKDYVYKHNGISDDHPKNDIRMILDDNVQFMHQALLTGGKVLVHCYSGVSRSAITVMAYLVKHQGLSSVDAYHKVLARRGIVDPWPNYLRQFQSWSEQQQPWKLLSAQELRQWMQNVDNRLSVLHDMINDLPQKMKGSNTPSNEM